MIQKMDPQTEQNYWRLRAHMATQLAEYWDRCYEQERARLNAEQKNPDFRRDTRTVAIAYADTRTAELQRKQWQKLEIDFEGYEI